MSSERRTRKKKRISLSLAEQLSELSNPKPANFHPDEEFLGVDTAAKLCDFSYEDDEEEEDHLRHEIQANRGTTKSRLLAVEDDPKYAGKVVSRTDLVDEYESDDSEIDMDSDEDKQIETISCDSSEDDVTSGNDQSDSGESLVGKEIAKDGEEDDDVSDEEQQMGEGAQLSGGIATISLASLQEDVEKGKAAKHQIAMWDGFLEARIKMQKALALSNRLPQCDTMATFLQEGGQPVQDAMAETRTQVIQLLDKLLDIQQKLLLRNKDTRGIMGGTSSNRGDDAAVSSACDPDLSSDEDVPSDLEDNESHKADEEESDEQVESDQKERDSERRRRKRKRKHDWITSNGERDYEGYISRLHQNFKSYQDATISKWNNKTKLTSGKFSSKAFFQLDRSVLSQIEHVLKDKDRLRRRTQLKRSVYRVIGKGEESSDEVRRCLDANGDQDLETDQSAAQEHDAHLKDYDEEIFDDDDFYHQLLREFIERKMNYSETSDPIAMGRQWLELQKLRTKAKKKVDTKASKGRKIRYNVHPKLTNYMTPIQTKTYSDVSKNDLFSSLFGSRYGM